MRLFRIEWKGDQKSGSIKAMDGKLLLNLDDKIRGWTEYCRELYNQEGIDDPMRRAIPLSEMDSDNNDDDGTILWSEVEKAIQSWDVVSLPE